MVRTQIQLSENQYAALKRAAEARNISMAELIRRCVDGMLRTTVMLDMDERRKRALDVAGRFHSGKTDISEKHDRYFAEALED